MLRLSLTMAACCGVAAASPALAQTPIPGGLIDHDTVWTADGSPYLIQGNVLLAQGALLTIEPGAEVRFMGQYLLVVSGRVSAEGTSTAQIAFSDDGAGLGDFQFTDFASDDSVFKFCDFQGAGVESSRWFPLIEHCTFHHPQSIKAGWYPPTYAMEGDAWIAASTFEDGATLELALEGTLTFIGNEVYATSTATVMYVQYATTLNLLDNSFSCGTAIPLILSTDDCGGLVSGNVFVGQHVQLGGFVGTTFQNRFAVERILALNGGGSWLRNDIEFQFDGLGHGGLHMGHIVPGSAVRQNNIVGSGVPGADEYLLDVGDPPGLVVDATANWWGTTDEASIEDLVNHFMDSPQRPFADFVPFRTAPMPTIEEVTSVSAHSGQGDLGLLVYEWGPSNDIEPRKNGVTTLEVLFNGPMDALTATDPANVAITGAATGPYTGTVTLDLIPDTAGDVLVIDLDPALPNADCHTVDLTGMLSVDGADALNPAFTVRPLRGDINRDGVVNAVDRSSLFVRFGQTAAAAGPMYDYNGDGAVNAVDASQIRLNFGSAAGECP